MPSIETAVQSHYAVDELVVRVKEAMADAGLDPERPTPKDIAPFDQFHLGGADATEQLVGQFAPGPHTRVLDIGCGIGGPARFIAERYGAHVTGVDLTPEFIEAARELSQLVGLESRTSFEVGSVLDLPYEHESFDMVVMLHVGMNIPDKTALFREVSRVLSSDGRFLVYDLMARNGVDPYFPVPWASTPSMSFLSEPEVYRTAGRTVRLALTRQTDCYDKAVERLQKIRDITGGDALPAGRVGLGEMANEKFRNLSDAVLHGCIGPWEMIFEKFG